MLSLADLSELMQDQWMPDWRNEKTRLDRLDRWFRWFPDNVQIPRKATTEHKALRELAKVPWLGLVVTSTAQCLFVDGYRSMLDPVGDDDSGSPTGPWRIWQANGLDKRQAAIHRAALAYGYAYATVLPGQDFRGGPMPVIRGVSPRKLWAVYEDPAEDDWPEYAMRIVSEKSGVCKVKVYDEVNVYSLTVRGGPGPHGEPAVSLDMTERHGAGVCPVVRYCADLDLDGRACGEVEPHIPLAARINKTAYDRLLVQHFNSWKIRIFAGLEIPDEQEDQDRAKLKLAQDDVVMLEDENGKAWTLPETALAGFIDANGADIEHLASVTQTPTHELTGQLVNLSAEALAAARASQTQKVDGYKRGFGGSHTQALQLGSHYDGDTGHAEDITGRVTWQDTSIRSIAQAVDALGKASTMLHIPDQVLWGRIPGVEKADVEEWLRLAKSDDPLVRMQRELDRQAQPSTPDSPPDAVPAA